MSGEMKRALVDIAAPYIDMASIPVATELVDDIIERLAAGSPEVIEAMAEAWAIDRYGTGEWQRHGDDEQAIMRRHARAALAAGMKVIAEGGE